MSTKTTITPQNKAGVTTKGMPTNKTSLDKCVDMFFLAGASRGMSDDDKIQIFKDAFEQNKLIAMKLLFWSRDIRGGAGERDFFNACTQWLQQDHRDILEKNLELIPEYGYWKDVFHLDQDLIFPLIEEELIENENTLLAKWLPRQSRQNQMVSNLRPYLGMSPREYRKKLVNLSDTVEQKMSEKRWDEIEYGKLPSKAFSRYTQAFREHDPEGFEEFLDDVEEGEESINAGAIFPHELYEKWKRHDTAAREIDAQWGYLPDYMANTEQNILPVCDVSGSMAGLPMAVSVSLGLYLSERNKGAFENMFMTFSAAPELQILEGGPTQRMQQLRSADWGYNTNLQAVFDTLLQNAKDYSVPEEDMPDKILIISDMEFDQATSTQRYSWRDDQPKVENDKSIDYIRRTYQDAGYELPEVIFWNVDGRIGNVPDKADVKNVGLVSGFSPSIMKAILAGEGFTPRDIMMRVATDDRYKPISV